jgi:hypothetical protein
MARGDKLATARSPYVLMGGQGGHMINGIGDPAAPVDAQIEPFSYTPLRPPVGSVAIRPLPARDRAHPLSVALDVPGRERKRGGKWA